MIFMLSGFQSEQQPRRKKMLQRLAGREAEGRERAGAGSGRPSTTHKKTNRRAAACQRTQRPTGAGRRAPAAAVARLAAGLARMATHVRSSGLVGWLGC